MAGSFSGLLPASTGIQTSDTLFSTGLAILTPKCITACYPSVSYRRGFSGSHKLEHWNTFWDSARAHLAGASGIYPSIAGLDMGFYVGGNSRVHSGQGGKLEIREQTFNLALH